MIGFDKSPSKRATSINQQRISKNQSVGPPGVCPYTVVSAYSIFNSSILYYRCNYECSGSRTVIFLHSNKNISSSSFTKRKLKQNSILVVNQSPNYSDSLISNLNIVKQETSSSTKDSSKPSSIHSNDHHDSSSVSFDHITIDARSRTQPTYLLSFDFVQSAANFIYPNVRRIVSGYFIHETNETEKKAIYIFPHTSTANKTIPLIFLGSEYFFRKPMNFESVRFPLSTNEHLEPLIDLFIHRPQFLQEVPQLNNLSNYLFLPQSISAVGFFDSSFHSSIRHLCYELRTKENQTKFTMKDLLSMSQRENNIIQVNALHDQRYHALKDQLIDIYSSEKKR